MVEKPLYDDGQLQITLHENPEEHLLWIKKQEEEYKTNYFLPRGVLKDFALTKRGKLESRLNTFNPEIWHSLTINDLNINDLHITMLQAYIEDLRRYRDSKKQ